jgi:protein-S-isoprenylcysteine O-methyltransferase Ste14
LAERGKTNTNSPTWDKILLPAFWILNYFVVYLLAGIAEGGEHLTLVFWLGIVLISLAAWISTKATLENTFLESTARIQSDRNQKVCTTGPYRIVRHPAYCGLIINCIGLSLIFPYYSVWTCMGATAVIIVIRTALEDRMLRKGLDGYLAYTKQTKYRLIPFIW